MNAEKLTKLCLQHQSTPNLLTIREAAKKLRAKQSKILELAEDLGYCVNIGVRCGNGI